MKRDFRAALRLVFLHAIPVALRTPHCHCRGSPIPASAERVDLSHNRSAIRLPDRQVRIRLARKIQDVTGCRYEPAAATAMLA
jgi:hypothetical protein